MQEVQHRVANSLQIIASVLLQSARKVQSDETRSYLRDAHNRVMSIATVQQQLAASRLGDVELGAYFKQLCQSLGASMIKQGPNWTLTVADNGVGMPKGPPPKPGLGASVVEALANQTESHVQVSGAKPGAKVSIVHTQLAVVGDEPRQAAV